MAVQELATKFAELESSEALREEVAKLVGGSTCKPQQSLKHSEMVDLLYHSSFKYSRGSTTKAALPKSTAEKLRREKCRGAHNM